MDKKTKAFKEMLEWQILTLKQSLNIVKNLRENRSEYIDGVKCNNWLDKEEKGIENKIECIYKTIEAYNDVSPVNKPKRYWRWDVEDNGAISKDAFYMDEDGCVTDGSLRYGKSSLIKKYEDEFVDKE